MVAYELLAETQRDLSAKLLRNLSNKHYKQ
jgi:hypothetical protein